MFRRHSCINEAKMQSYSLNGKWYVRNWSQTGTVSQPCPRFGWVSGPSVSQRVPNLPKRVPTCPKPSKTCPNVSQNPWPERVPNVSQTCPNVSQIQPGAPHTLLHKFIYATTRQQLRATSKPTWEINCERRDLKWSVKASSPRYLFVGKNILSTGRGQQRQTQTPIATPWPAQTFRSIAHCTQVLSRSGLADVKRGPKFSISVVQKLLEALTTCWPEKCLPNDYQVADRHLWCMGSVRIPGHC